MEIYILGREKEENFHFGWRKKRREGKFWKSIKYLFGKRGEEDGKLKFSFKRERVRESWEKSIYVKFQNFPLFHMQIISKDCEKREERRRRLGREGKNREERGDNEMI